MKLLLLLGTVCLITVIGFLLSKGGEEKSHPSHSKPSHAVAENQAKLARHLEEKAETERVRRVELDEALARGTLKDTDESDREVTSQVLELTREMRNKALRLWGLNEKQIIRIEEVQFEHWMMQLLDSRKYFSERPLVVGDRKDPQRVAAFE